MTGSVGPGSAADLFDTIQEWGAFSSPDPDEMIFGWEWEKVLDFVAACRDSAPYYWGGAPSQFSFIANTQLRGGPRPCFELRCRAERAGHLARFASLYADQVLIPDPFWDFEERRSDSLATREDLSNDLIAMLELRPMMEAGLIAIASPDIPLCDHHHQEWEQQHEDLQKAAARVVDAVVAKYQSEATIKSVLEGNGDSPYLRVEGPEDLVEHGEYRIVNLWPEVAQQIIDDPSGPLSEDYVRRVLERVYGIPVADDLLIQNWYSRAHGFKYLTDRQVDLDVLHYLNPGPTNLVSQRVLAALGHEVPTVAGLDVDAVIELREKEGEAFRVYRDALNQLLREASASASEDELAEAFTELVEPQLRKLDKAVANSRKLVKDSLREQLVFGSGAIAVGAFFGVLPADLSFLGAAAGAAKLLREANALVKDPPEVRESDFYFLWKATR